MQTHENILIRNGLRLYTVRWLPDSGEPRASVLLVHGIGEHCQRYAHVAEALTAAGFAVYALDHRGHGRSEGERTYFQHFDDAVNDLEAYFDQIRSGQTFVYAHSLGTLIALRLTLRRQSDMAGLIITGTPLDTETTYPAWVVTLLSALRPIVPRFPIPGGLPNTVLSRDPAVIAAHTADPLNNHQPVKLTMGYHIVEQSRFILGQLQQIRLPLLVMHGTADRVAPSTGSEKAHQLAASADKTLKLWPGLYHEIHNEPEKAQVIAAMIEWMNGHV